MEVRTVEAGGKKYREYISKSFEEITKISRTCKGKFWINLHNLSHWMLSEELEEEVATGREI